MSDHTRHVLLSFLAILITAGLVVPAQAQHPTAVTSIVNSDQDTTLEANHNGSLLAPGTFISDGTENDSIPATGAGTRLMWYPAKAAFRAGRVGVFQGGTQWDASKIGDYSAAFGVDTKADGTAAFATGALTSAGGAGATAMGSETRATGEAALALGEGTTADSDNATAMGLNTTANAYSATAMGRATTASGVRSTAMGFGTTASGTNATAIGRDASAGGTNALAAGRDVSAGGNQAMAFGFGAVAATDGSLAIGTGNWANDSPDNTLFVAGNGRTSPTDALVLDFDGNLEISGTLTESSDRRLKTDIEPLGARVLSSLRDIRPVRYRFKNQNAHPSGEQIGLIAQEVRNEFPSLVHTGANGMLSLTYSKFTAVLLKGLQEQQRQIDTQKTQIATLRAENKAMKDQQAELQKRLATLEAKSSSSILAGFPPVSGLVLAVMVLGMFGTGLLWRRRT